MADEQTDLNSLKAQWAVRAPPRPPRVCFICAAPSGDDGNTAPSIPPPRIPAQSIESTGVKTSVACNELIDYTKTTEEPFSPDFPPGNNPWMGQKGGGGGGGCAIL